MSKCQWPDGATVKPDGIHELDPCVYVERQSLHNVDIVISECPKCGAIDISWERNDDTEVIYEDEEFVRRCRE